MFQVRVMEERLQAEWTTHLPDQAEKEQAISKLATQVEEQVCRLRVFGLGLHRIKGFCRRYVRTFFLRLFRIQFSFNCDLTEFFYSDYLLRACEANGVILTTVIVNINVASAEAPGCQNGGS